MKKAISSRSAINWYKVSYTITETLKSVPLFLAQFRVSLGKDRKVAVLLTTDVQQPGQFILPVQKSRSWRSYSDFNYFEIMDILEICKYENWAKGNESD